MLRIARVSPHTPDVARLVAALDSYQIGLYGEDCCHLDSLEALSQRNVVMLGAFEGDALAGIGAVKLFEGYGELKRVVVDEAHQRKGVGRAIVEALEAEVAAHGLATVRLETGIHQHAALALYAACGYVTCPPFGCYQANDTSVFMAKSLIASCLHHDASDPHPSP